jgi:hypothetical protein
LWEYLGDDAFAEIESQFGAKAESILMVLNSYKYCMLAQFSIPRREFKQAGLGHHTSWLIPKSNQEISALCSLISRLPPRSPVEPRSPERIVELTVDFFPQNLELEAEARTIFDLFAQDIHADNVSLLDKLLIKNSNCDILLPRLWSGDVKTFLFNAAFRNKKIGRLASTHFEKRVGSLFEIAGFKTLVGFPLRNDGQIEGEIDVAAYQDGTLFLIEAKMTYMRETPEQVAHVGRTFEKASHQLQRVIPLLPEYWADISDQLGIKEEFERINVIPLIVSNSFEYDHLYFRDILKVTIFELEMVFRNNPVDIFQLVNSLSVRMFDEADQAQLHQKLAEQMSKMSEDDQRALLEERYSLFPFGKMAKAGDLVEALENNRLWSIVFGSDFGLTPLRP